MANKKINSDLEVSGEISASGEISSSSNGSFQGDLVVESEISLNDDNRVIFDKNEDGFSWIKSDTQNADGLGSGAMLYGADISHHFINGDDFSYLPVNASKFVTDGGTSSQFVKGDGSLDSNTYLSTSLTEGQFLRSDITDTKTSGNLTFNDNVALVLGTGGDALLYQTGSENRLQLNANDFAIRDSGTLRFTFGRTTGDFTATGNVIANNLIVSNQSGIEVRDGNISGLLDFDFPEVTSVNATYRFGRLTNTTGAVQTQFYDNTDANVIINHTTGSIAATGDITTTDNIGIGTTSPSEKLEIEDTTPIVKLTNSTEITWSGGEELGGTELHIADTSGIGARKVTSIKSINDRVGAGTTVAGALAFSVSAYNDNTSEALRISSDGNIGVGTDNPSVKMHVAGSTGELLRLDDSSATGNPLMSFYQNGGRRSLIQHVDDLNMLSLVSEYGGVRMMTANNGVEVNRFQINSAGRVMLAREGITGSMTASIYDFNITGNNFNDKYLNFWSQDGTNNPRAWLKHSSSASTQEIEFNSVFSTGSGYADFAFRRGTTPIMFLNESTQRVGIGTETPTYNLDVTGAQGIRVTSVSDIPLRVISTDDTSGIELGDNVNTYYLLSTGSDFRVRDVTGGSVDRLTIEGTTGDVGIGTTLPEERLHVSDSGATTVLIQDTDTSKAATANLNFKAAGTEVVKMEAVVGAASAATGGGLRVSTATNNSGGYNDDILVLTNDNKVGIGGVASPNSTLQVNGGIQMADDTTTAISAKVGTLRYRTSGNNSYVDMCMQTGASTYAWVNIQTNSW